MARVGSLARVCGGVVLAEAETLMAQRCFLFVGERRSPRAIRMGVRLQDGRLAGRSLFDALEVCNINPQDHLYANLFERRGFAWLRKHEASGVTIVAMGRKVQAALTRAGIPHRSLVHPAARGAIRRKRRYAAHVRHVLTRKEAT